MSVSKTISEICDEMFHALMKNGADITSGYRLTFNPKDWPEPIAKEFNGEGKMHVGTYTSPLGMSAEVFLDLFCPEGSAFLMRVEGHRADVVQ